MDALLLHWPSLRRKSLTVVAQEYCELYWTSPGNSIPQSSGWHLPTISKTNQTKRARHAGHCWISKSELISDVLLWTPLRARVEWSVRTYLQQLCTDTGCSTEGPTEKWWTIGTSDRSGSGKSVPAVRHDIYIYIYICVCVCVCMCVCVCVCVWLAK